MEKKELLVIQKTEQKKGKNARGRREVGKNKKEKREGIKKKQLAPRNNF